MSVSFVGCKDYDDDIDAIHETNDAMSKQIAALETALKQNQEAAQAAANAAQQAIKDAAAAAEKGDKALAEAQAAAAQAELAKQAAATAKAEAIAEVIAQLKPLIDANTAGVAENASKIAQLLGRIEGIEADLKKIDLAEVNSQVNENTKAIEKLAAQYQAVETQLKALEAFKTSAESQLSALDGKVAGLSADLKTLSGKIDAVSTELTDLKGRVSKLETSVANNTASIATINGQITAINGELQALSTKITTEINNAVSTIAGTISKRLTSVTLMPDLYIGGIPTIEFTSAKYVSKVLDKGEWVVKQPTSKTFIISNNETEAQYRLNPATIGEEDIVKGSLAYVSRIATARSGEVENDIVNVASSSVENGVLTVKLGKSNTESLNLSGDKVYTVSLKVPVAEEHLFKAQGETEFSVYSEYTRLNEAYFTPELRYIPGEMNNPAVNDHLNDSVTMFNSGMDRMVAKSVVYNKTFDLNTLVQGCKFFSVSRHEGMTTEQLEKYGLKIYYHVANHEYKVTSSDVTDQQKFAKIEGSILTPVLPSGEANNRTIIGKQPIIAATLYDVVNKKVVEQKYLKIHYAANELDDLEFTLPTHNTNLVCGDQVYSVTWGEMVSEVLSKYPEGGISKEEFAKIYRSGQYVAIRKDTEAPAGSFYMNLDQDNTGASTPIFTWKIPSDELGKLEPGKTYTYVAQVVMSESLQPDYVQLYPNVVISFEWNITVPASPTLGATDKIKWDNEIMKVYPVPMAIPYDGTSTAEYATNILEGRNKSYVKGLMDCATWDLDFKLTTPYQGVISYDAPYGHWLMTKANQDQLDQITYTIDHNATGIALVQRTVKNGYYDIVLDWKTDINGLAINRYKFANSTLRLLQILKLNTVAGKSITDDSKSQTINLNEALSMNDAYGNVVAKNNTSANPYAGDYYKYYVVETPVFGSKIMLADDAEGKVNLRSLEGLNMTANIDVATGTLTFQNNGAPLAADAYLIVPVKVNHKWGVLEDNIAVPLKKKL